MKVIFEDEPLMFLCGLYKHQKEIFINFMFLSALSGNRSLFQSFVFIPAVLKYSKYDVILFTCSGNCIQMRSESLLKVTKGRSKKIV